MIRIWTEHYQNIKRTSSEHDPKLSECHQIITRIWLEHYHNNIDQNMIECHRNIIGIWLDHFQIAMGTWSNYDWKVLRRPSEHHRNVAAHGWPSQWCVLAMEWREQTWSIYLVWTTLAYFGRHFAPAQVSVLVIWLKSSASKQRRHLVHSCIHSLQMGLLLYFTQIKGDLVGFLPWLIRNQWACS